MFEEELNLLLEKEWSKEEREMMTKLLKNLTYYKKLIPKSLKQDIAIALQMCNTLKTELETFRTQCTCVNKYVKEISQIQQTDDLTNSLKQFETSVEKLEISMEQLESDLNKEDLNKNE